MLLVGKVDTKPLEELVDGYLFRFILKSAGVEALYVPHFFLDHSHETPLTLSCHFRHRTSATRVKLAQHIPIVSPHILELDHDVRNELLIRLIELIQNAFVRAKFQTRDLQLEVEREQSDFTHVEVGPV